MQIKSPPVERATLRGNAMVNIWVGVKGEFHWIAKKSMENIEEEMAFKEIVQKDDHDEDRSDEVIKRRQACSQAEEELSGGVSGGVESGGDGVVRHQWKRGEMGVGVGLVRLVRGRWTIVYRALILDCYLKEGSTDRVHI